MIKGVNRQMIEVTQTDSPFYERALFVVKPEYAGESYEALRITVCFCPKNGKDRHKKETLLIWIIGGALAALP